MANRILFIGEDDIKNSLPVSLNLDVSIVNASIYDAQYIYIQDIIGTKLYKKMVSIIEVDPYLSGSTVTNYKTLLFDYIKPCLIYYTLSELYLYSSVRITNKGVKNLTSDNSESVDENMLNKAEARSMVKADYLKSRLNSYLLDNDSLFPEYLNLTSIQDTLPATGYFINGIYVEESFNLSELTGKNNIGM